MGLIVRPRNIKGKYKENDILDGDGKPRFSDHHLLSPHLLKITTEKEKKEKERKKRLNGLYK